MIEDRTMPQRRAVFLFSLGGAVFLPVALYLFLGPSHV
jgi:hypothetical protein